MGPGRMAHLLGELSGTPEGGGFRFLVRAHTKVAGSVPGEPMGGNRFLSYINVLLSPVLSLSSIE